MEHRDLGSTIPRIALEDVQQLRQGNRSGNHRQRQPAEHAKAVRMNGNEDRDADRHGEEGRPALREHGQLDHQRRSTEENAADGPWQLPRCRQDDGWKQGHQEERRLRVPIAERVSKGGVYLEVVHRAVTGPNHDQRHQPDYCACRSERCEREQSSAPKQKARPDAQGESRDIREHSLGIRERDGRNRRPEPGYQGPRSQGGKRHERDECRPAQTSQGRRREQEQRHQRQQHHRPGQVDDLEVPPTLPRPPAEDSAEHDQRQGRQSPGGHARKLTERDDVLPMRAEYARPVPRLGVYTDYTYSVSQGTPYAERAFALFIGALAEKLDRVVVIGRLDPGSEPRYPLGHVDLVLLPNYPSLTHTRQAIRGMLGSLRPYWRALDDLDCVWILGPHPLAIAFALLARLRGRTVILGVRQESVAYMRSRHPDSRIRLALARATEACFRALSRRWPAVVVGPALASAYARGRAVLEISVSLIQEADVGVGPPSRDYSGRLTALSVGRLETEKNPVALADVIAT